MRSLRGILRRLLRLEGKHPDPKISFWDLIISGDPIPDDLSKLDDVSRQVLKDMEALEGLSDDEVCGAAAMERQIAEAGRLPCGLKEMPDYRTNDGD